MYSINFPKMFSSAKTNLVRDKEAIKQNILLLFKSIRGELFGDPGYGTDLIRFIYSQNHSVIVDLIIDEIYMGIKLFIPQVLITRSDISIEQTKTQLIANVRVIYKDDLSSDLYQIPILDTGDNV